MTKELDPTAVLTKLQERFPREFDICIQAAHIDMLNAEIAKLSDDGADADGI